MSQTFEGQVEIKGPIRVTLGDGSYFQITPGEKGMTILFTSRHGLRMVAVPLRGDAIDIVAVPVESV